MNQQNFIVFHTLKMYVKRILPSLFTLRSRFITANNNFEHITNNQERKRREKKKPQRFQLVDGTQHLIRHKVFEYVH